MRNRNVLAKVFAQSAGPNRSTLQDAGKNALVRHHALAQLLKDAAALAVTFLADLRHLELHVAQAEAIQHRHAAGVQTANREVFAELAGLNRPADLPGKCSMCSMSKRLTCLFHVPAWASPTTPEASTVIFGTGSFAVPFRLGDIHGDDFNAPGHPLSPSRPTKSVGSASTCLRPCTCRTR